MEYGKIAVVVTKVEETWEVDFDALPEASRRGIVAYGLKQLLNDCGGGKGVTAEEKKAESLKRLDALRAGTYRFGAGGGKGADPVEAEARMMVARALVTQKGMKMAEAIKAARVWREGMPPARVEAVLAKARKVVKERELDLDLGV